MPVGLIAWVVMTTSQPSSSARSESSPHHTRTRTSRMKGPIISVSCSGPNPFSADVQLQMIGFIGEGAVKAWNKHAHPPKAGYTPLEVFGG